MIFKRDPETEAQRELAAAERAVKQGEKDLAQLKIVHAHKLAVAMAIRAEKRQEAKTKKEKT